MLFGKVVDVPHVAAGEGLESAAGGCLLPLRIAQVPLAAHGSAVPTLQQHLGKGGQIHRQAGGRSAAGEGIEYRCSSET